MKLNYKFSKFDAVRLFFSRDKESFLWKHVTSEEKVLNDMDVWQLADIILEANDHTHETAQRKIVAEHKLNIRLSKIQARATWGAGSIGFTGAVLGSLITIGALNLFNVNNSNIKSFEEKVTCGASNNESPKPIKKTVEPIIKTSKTIKSIPASGIIFIKKPIKDNKKGNPNKEQ